MADQTFGIIVEIDPRRAIPTIDQVEGKLASAERTGKRAGRSISDEFEKAAQSALKSVEKSTAAMAREHEKLAKATAAGAQRAAREQAAAAKAAADQIDRTWKSAARAAADDARAQTRAQTAAARAAAAASKQAAREQEEYARHVTATVERAARERAAAERAAYRETVAAARAASREQASAARAAASQQRAAARQGQLEARASAGGGNLGAIAGGVGIPLGPAAAAAAAVALGKGALDLSDSYANLTSRLITLTGEESKAIPLREKLLAIAAETKSANTAIVELYARTAGSAKELGISEGRLLDFTERLTKSFKTSGASAVAQQQAMIQLAQGMGAGALRGEEFNSVMEAAPNIIDVIGQHLGKTRGQMRAMAEEGALTTGVIIEAFEKAGDDIDEKFGKRIVTTADHVQGFKNKLEVTVGELGKSVNVSALAGQALGDLGKSLEVVGAIVQAQVGLWKDIDDATDGWLGKIAKAPGLLGGISNAVDALAGDGGLLRLMTEDIVADTKALEANTAAIRRRTAALYESLPTTVGSGTGLSARDEIDLDNRIDELERRKAARAKTGLTAGESDRMRGLAASAAAKRRLEEMGDAYEQVEDGVSGFYARLAWRASVVRDGVIDLGERAREAGAKAKQSTDYLTQFYQQAGEMGAEGSDVAKLGDGLRGVADGFLEMAMAGEKSFGDLANGAAIAVAKMLIQFGLLQGAKSIFGEGSTAFGAASEIIGSFASGGSVTVPNNGRGTDGVPLFIRASPGERVRVETPGQQAAQGNGPAPIVPVTVNNNIDPRMIVAALDSPDGHSLIANVIDRYAGQILGQVQRSS